MTAEVGMALSNDAPRAGPADEVRRRVEEAMAGWKKEPFRAGRMLNDLVETSGLSIWQLHKIAPVASAPTMETLASLARLPTSVRVLVGLGSFTRSNAQILSRYMDKAPEEIVLRAARSLVDHPMRVQELQGYGSWYMRTGEFLFPENDDQSEVA